MSTDSEVRSLLVRLASDDKRERFAAVERLRELSGGVRDVILEALTSGDWKVRASGAAVLDHAPQDPDVERALTAAAADPDAAGARVSVPFALVYALQAIGMRGR